MAAEAGAAPVRRMIDFLLLGTGGMQPLPDRWLSSLLVRCEGELILFDCGEGTQIPWKSFGWGFRRLAAICISHYHADHIAGLPGLLHSVANAGRTDPVDLFGPEGTGEIVAGLRVIAPRLPYELRIHELASGERFDLPSGLQGRTLAGEHGLPCLLYRADLARERRFDPGRATALEIPRQLWSKLQNGEPVTWPGGNATPEHVLGRERRGLAFAYVTDTRALPAFSPFLQDVDLLVCEGTYGDTGDTEMARTHHHMTFAQAATIAREANAGRLWLTHFSARLEDPSTFVGNATTIFPATEISYSGLSTTLSFVDE